MRQKIQMFATVMIIIALGTGIFYLTDVQCMFKYVIGIPCPGCGLTRAWLSFLKGHYLQALWWHPLFWLVPVLIGVQLFIKPKSRKARKYHLIFWIGMGILVIGFYIVRMVNMFPNEPPMDYRKESVLGKLLVH